MRIIYMLFIGLLSFGVIAQNDTIQQSKPEPQKENIRLYYIIPSAVGDNVLAKANEGKFGFGLGLTLFSVSNFHFGGGFEFTKYDVTDAALAGNIENTNISHFYGEVMYKLPVTNTISLNPKVAIGYINIHQKTGSESFGRQEGPGYTLGFNVDYRLTGRLRVFAGMNYSMLRPKTKTNAAEMDFYHDLNQLNIMIGLKI